MVVMLAIILTPIVSADTEVNISASTNENLTMNIGVRANNSEITIDGVNLNNDYQRTKRTIQSIGESSVSWYDLYSTFDPGKSQRFLDQRQLDLKQLFFQVFMSRNELINHFMGLVYDMEELWIQQRIIEKKADIIAEYLNLNITALDKKATLQVMEDKNITRLTRNNITYYRMQNSDKFVELVD
jgi:hypothetical protein